MKTIEQAKKIIEGLTPLQENPPTDGHVFPCPRCGHHEMNENPVKNSLSRYVNVYICSECGQEEAMLNMIGKKPLPLNEWAIVQGFDDKK
jgi:transcription elongation factor Elf1